MTTLLLRAVPHIYDSIPVISTSPALLARWTINMPGQRRRWHIP